jgi:alpha/beta hydrolase fold
VFKKYRRNSLAWAGEHWTASPVRAPQDLLRKYPKTTIIAAKEDLLFPESKEFGEKLRGVGVDVDVKVYEGAPHVFMAMDKYLDLGRQAIHYVVERVREVLVEHPLDIKPSDVKNERDRQTPSEQAKNHQDIDQIGSEGSLGVFKVDEQDPTSLGVPEHIQGT